MKLLSIVSALLVSYSSYVQAVDKKDLTGTWSSKSNQVFTGPGFYDPVDELIIEPSLPGISYSFTEDGHWEMATYLVSGNPKDPTCPSAAITFQHGSYDLLDNGTLILNPIAVDGRQLVSDPCNDNGVSTYNRYNQTINFHHFYTQLDDYHGMYKLQLFQFDESPLQPLYLAYRPPMMLPTETLNPTEAATSDNAKPTGKQKRSLRDTVRRNLENRHRTNAVKSKPKSILNSDLVWYLSAGMIGVGSVVFLSS
ncbi:hypothetical protein ZYGR_0I02340 [Zygosaccharomyces rouxii]|uniref:Protein ROT1 n=2 Tax=Zygosaccharomyces rouxii TaxID=4956 RepID=C5DT53_ZYGRC|nr:uncharacterized protein ZYRO0C05566g [Zygosaccharomyces rouxii]KAH9201850.1 chaperone for protein-folding within the ER, fungal-domain-containing protein [Zygosaccharomyces rouxii]GAV47938.1 hypothetical protein ZYGR_0I02340 [Zygosaccharomyces rouxii]CAR26964.1 ZYRO0C05566p [Zygosaccharomyces rouxii]